MNSTTTALLIGGMFFLLQSKKTPVAATTGTASNTSSLLSKLIAALKSGGGGGISIGSGGSSPLASAAASNPNNLNLQNLFNAWNNGSTVAPIDLSGSVSDLSYVDPGNLDLSAYSNNVDTTTLSDYLPTQDTSSSSYIDTTTVPAFDYSSW